MLPASWFGMPPGRREIAAYECPFYREP